MYIGIDVSKGSLDVKSTGWKEVKQYKNSKAGIKKLISDLAEEEVELIVMESTGGYERNVAKALSESGHKVAVMNPWQIRNFAKGLGRRAKTDKIDAEILSLFAQIVKPAATRILNDEEFELRQLVLRRIQLVTQKTQEKNRLEHASPVIAKNIRAMLKELRKQIKGITKEINRWLAEHKIASDLSKLLQSAQGVGEVVGFSFYALLPEIGTLNRKEVAALVGVDPYNRASGNFAGQRSIAGGRSEIRSVLYMATLTAIRSNEKIKPFYKKLLSRGKKKKVAIVACMRKFLICLNAMAKTKTPWQSQAK